MAYRVEISRRARRDTDRILEYLDRQSFSAGARWYTALENALQSLREYPERVGLAPEAEDFGIELRQLLFGKRRGVYRILFTIDDDLVTVWRIRHSAQDLLKLEEL